MAERGEGRRVSPGGEEEAAVKGLHVIVSIVRGEGGGRVRARGRRSGRSLTVAAAR